MKSYYSQLLLLLVISWAVVTSAQDEATESATPAEGEVATPAEGETAAPAEGETAVPAEGEGATPAEGETAAPAEGETAAPAEGETGTAAEGEVAVPAEGEGAPPAAEEGVPPATGENATPAEGEIEAKKTDDAVELEPGAEPKENAEKTGAEKASPDNPSELDSECKPNEMLTATKGCVDRDDYLQRVMLNTWGDEALDEVKNKAGLDRSIECKEGEILTAYGCEAEKIPVRSRARAPVVGGTLFGNVVYKSRDIIPDTEVSKEAVQLEGADPADPKPHHSRQRKKDRNLGHVAPPAMDPSQRTIGHNRPRSFVYMPGRRLASGRKCRPYEVLTSKKRCIRKKGKVGFYQHKDHTYGLQRRHRHPKGTN